MGTRSLTRFIETFNSTDKKTNVTKRVNDEIVVMYRQYDGYLSGHGLELAEFLSDGTMVNGFGREDLKLFNGMGCLAAQVVAHFKKGTGGFYLHKAKTKNCWEEFDYHIIYDTDTKVLSMKCFQVGNKRKLVFEGTPQEFLAKFATVAE